MNFIVFEKVFKFWKNESSFKRPSLNTEMEVSVQIHQTY